MYTFTHVCVSGRVSCVTLDIIYCFTVLPAIIAAISVAAKHNLYRIPASYDKGNPDYHKIRAYVNELFIRISQSSIFSTSMPILFRL